jgi:hypothetical protein
MKKSSVTMGNELSLSGLKNGDVVIVYIKDGSFKSGNANYVTMGQDLKQSCRDSSNNGGCGRWEAPAFTCGATCN